MSIEAKRLKEQQVAGEMIRLYCRKNHRSKDAVCFECRELLDYAEERSSHCPFMENKTFCSNCSVHCYRPDMRERMRLVMAFSGPRMLFCHPGMALWHLICSVKEKNKRDN